MPLHMLRNGSFSTTSATGSLALCDDQHFDSVINGFVGWGILSLVNHWEMDLLPLSTLAADYLLLCVSLKREKIFIYREMYTYIYVYIYMHIHSYGNFSCFVI